MIYENSAGLSVRRERGQNNFNSKLFAASLGGAEGLLKVTAPERSPQKCERYLRQELTVVPMETQGVQTIISETSTIGDVRARIRAIRKRKRELGSAYALRLRTEWRRLCNVHTERATRWKKTFTMAFRKAKWVKMPTGQYHVIKKRVLLKPRPQWVRHKVRIPGTFQFIWQTHFYPAYRPAVMRELIVPVYVKHVVRKAGLRRVTVRKMEHYWRKRWDLIKPQFVVFKINARVLLDEQLAQLDRQLEPLLRKLAQRMEQPRRMVTCTNLGWIPVSDREFAARYSSGAISREAYYYHPHLTVDVTTEIDVLGWHIARDSVAAMAFQYLSPYGRLYSGDDGTLREKMRAFSHVSVDTANAFSVTQPDGDHPRTVIGSLVQLDNPLQSDLSDSQQESLAASSVEHLRNKKDYVFNLVRSIAELKDSKETFKQGYDFIRWYAQATKNGELAEVLTNGGFRLRFVETLRRTRSGVMALISVYLASKFAIQPTIEDILTVKRNSQEWLLSTRRALSDTIRGLKKVESNILHIRAKFRGLDAVRRKELTDIVRIAGGNSEVVEISSIQSFGMPAFGYGRIGEEHQPTFSLEEWDPGDSFQWLFPQQTPFQINLGAVAGDLTSVDYSCVLPPVSRSFYTSDRTKEVTNELDARLVSGSLRINGKNLVSDEFTLDEDEAAKLLAESASEYLSVPVPGYVRNQVEGVAFARYRLDNLVELLGQDSLLQGLEKLELLANQLADTLFVESDKAFSQSVYGRLFAAGKQAFDGVIDVAPLLDAIFVAWQIYPLSFVYDWFTTSDSVVQMINNMSKSWFIPAPPSLEGVWMTKRVELLGGRPGLQLVDSTCSYYVSDWWTAKCRTIGHGTESPYAYWASPQRVMTTCSLRYELDCEVKLERTGLYAVKRGEFIANGWETFLPQVQVKLNAGKVGTLLGILAGFLQPRK